jgi:hypothetical protein
MLDQIATGLKAVFTPQLVDELLAAYMNAKQSYYHGGLRLNAVEGGRFCEAALRILEEAATGKYTPIGRQLDTEKIINSLPNYTSQPDSIRFHIPRSIRLVYDIRNKRDAAHLADGIDPNQQDATLVVSVLDWIVAELVRLYHGMSAKDAQVIVDGLVQRKVPAIQNFGGFRKVLKPKLRASDFVLLLLYECGEAGASYVQLNDWVPPKMRANLRRTLELLVHSTARVHTEGGWYYLTRLGVADVEKRRLHEVAG